MTISPNTNVCIKAFTDSGSGLPVANFSSDVTSGYAPLSVQFTDSSLNATAWNWNFGDGNNSNEQNPSHTYSIAGNYTITLTANNANGTDSKSATITVLEKSAQALPVADFSSDVTQGPAPLAVQFTDNSQNATSRIWDFGDGYNSTDKNPNHTYFEDGTYTVTLTVRNEAGSDTKTGTIVVGMGSNDNGNNSNDNGNNSNDNGNNSNDNGNNSNDNGNNSNDDGNNSSDNGNNSNDNGNNSNDNVSTDNGNGSTDSGNTDNGNSSTNTVCPCSNPVADFSTCSTSETAPMKVKFTDKSKGNPKSWKWTFGDGTSSTCKTPSHTYSKAGKYTVTLTVKDAAGNTAKKCKCIVVSEPPQKKCTKNTKKVTNNTKKTFKDTAKTGNNTKKVSKAKAKCSNKN